MTKTNLPRIFITQFLRPSGQKILEEAAEVTVNPLGRPLTEDEMIELAGDSDAFLSPFAEPHRVFSARVIAACPNLKVIGWTGVGFDHVDLDAATERGIYVTFNDIQCSTVADQAVGLMLVAARRLIPAHEAVRRGEWESKGYNIFRNFMGTNLHGKTVGVAGLGRIGSEVAKRVKGFDTRIIYYDQVKRPDIEKELGAMQVDFPTLLRESDFISCNLPLNTETANIFDAEAFATMKPNCIFVNTSRGKCVDTQALYEALRDNRIEMAALDVIEPEPFPTHHPIMQLSSFILVPHSAGMTRETEEQQHIDVARETLRVLRGYRANKILNPKVLDVRPLPQDPAQ